MSAHENNEQEMMQTIERDEAWLRSVVQQAPTPDVTQIKMRVRVELQEQWLAGHAVDEVPHGLAGRVKARVQRELATIRRRRRMDRLVKWGGPALAMAACLVAAGWILFPAIVPETHRSPSGSFSFVEAFDEYSSETEFRQTFADIEDDIQAIESSLETTDGLEGSAWSADVDETLDELFSEEYLDT